MSGGCQERLFHRINATPFGVYTIVQQLPKTVKRLNLQLSASVDAMLREIASATELKLVTIISNGIKAEHKRWKGEKGK